MGAAGSYHVWVSDIQGHPTDAPLTARLLDAGQPVALTVRRATEKGQWLVDLPAHLPLTSASSPCLEMLAQGQKDAAPVRAYLRVLEPAYRTQLTIDSPVYQAGGTIHFRSLTLERFGHRIPDRGFTATYTLATVGGKELQTLSGLTRKDGIGGGELVLSPNWPAGEYTLTVAEAENRFPPATCRFQVGPIVPGPRKPPETDGLEVEFFPEGRELLAEVANRVYFRVRTPLGLPADLQGAIVDSQGREVVPVQTAGQEGQSEQTAGLGMFRLRPRVGETYSLQVTSPRALAIHAPFPAIRTTGLTLSLPNAVGGPREPFRTIIQHAGPERNLIVGLFCQGRLVAQELVAAKPDIAEVRLTPTISCSGVFRITVFEEHEGQLWPLAERLAYRQADKRLQLSVQADKQTYAPGDIVHLNVRTLNEQGKPEPAWVLVSVVNQAALSGDTRGAAPSLPAYFQLTSELPEPEELEQSDILLSDSPKAAAALDLFLGTQGWRRFQDSKTDANLVMANTTRRAQDLAVPAIVKLDNGAEAERRFASSLSQAVADWQDMITRRDRELASEGAARLQISRNTARELNAYEERAGGLVRLVVGLGGVVVFAAGCLLLGTALWRLIRGWGANRGYLAGAFAALSLCALILWGEAAGSGEASNSSNLARIAGFAAEVDQRFDVAALLLPPNHNAAPPSQALSKADGSFPHEASTAKRVATVGSNTKRAPQVQKTPSVAMNRPPWIGILRAVPSSEPPPTPIPVKNGPAPALPLRVYAYDPARPPAGNRAIPNSVFWQPLLFTQNGTADLSFTLPASAATYRVLAQGHDAAGRLATIQEKLECRTQGTP